MSLSKYLTDKKDWDSSSQQLIRFNKQRQPCYWVKTPKDRELDYLVGYPQNLKVYKPPESKCQRIDVITSEVVYSNQNAIKINQFLILGLILTKFFLF
jgi:hypothetical protein